MEKSDSVLHKREMIAKKIIADIENEVNNKNEQNERMVKMISREDIFKLLREVMEKLEVEKITSKEKKEVALVVMHYFAMSLVDPTIKTVFMSMLETGIISELIDVIVDASKGKIQINLSFAKRAGKLLFKCFKKTTQNCKKQNKDSVEEPNVETSQ